MTLEQIKADLLHKANLDALVKGMDGKEVTPSMDDIPVKQMIDCVNYIDKELLPAIKKKKGQTSADYEFFEKNAKLLLYAIAVVDRWELLNERWVRQLVELQLCKEHLQLMEKELSKYNALQDLYLTDGLDLYAKRVKKYADDLLQRRK